jgi:hypothetical protein
LSYIAVILAYGKLNQGILWSRQKIKHIAFWSINVRKWSVGLQRIRSLKKIDSFRSVFLKELLKVMKSARSAAGADDLHKPSVWYFDLSFLNDQENPRESISNIEDHSEQDVSYNHIAN